MVKEGVSFKTSINVGTEVKMRNLKKNYDAILLCSGSEKARDLNIPGRDATGIHFAMDFLPLQK